jgi:hypothetical protein
MLLGPVTALQPLWHPYGLRALWSDSFLRSMVLTKMVYETSSQASLFPEVFPGETIIFQGNMSC